MKQKNTASSNITIISTVISKQLGDKYYVLNPSEGKIYVMNEMSSYIWKLLIQGISTQNIIKNIIQTYAVSEKKVILDLNKFLNRCKQRRLIENIN